MAGPEGDAGFGLLHESTIDAVANESIFWVVILMTPTYT